MASDSNQPRSDRLVARQLKKSGMAVEPGSAEEQFVQRVRETYAEANEQRRLNEHAFQLASAEMAELNEELGAKNSQLENALESLMRSEQIEQLNAELSSKNNELSTLANTDSLTGLLNRYSFGRSLEHVAESVGATDVLAVAIIDLDRFKLVNDTFGHNVGDQLLKKVSDNLRGLKVKNDLIARLGGDEFAYARVVGSESQADEFVAELSTLLQKPILMKQQQLHGGGSVGLAMGTVDDLDPVRLMRDADIAMYRAKESADKRYQIFDLQFRQEVTRRYTLEREIRAAISAGDIRLAYQPIVVTATKSATILEALSRWNSPTLGSVPPPEFIPAIERLGLSIEFGRMTLVNVCRQIRQWRNLYPSMEDVAVTVNFASPQLLDVGLVEFIADTLRELELDGKCVIIELTESDLLQDFDRAVEVLSELRAMGIRIAIDDFGTGYSALAYLSRLPADFLKIDKAFVQNMETDSSVRRLTKIIVELAERFDLASIGEGVEVEAQSTSLQQFGCDYLQGYLYGKPAESDDVPALCGWIDAGQDQIAA